jgi:hypothetical protein
VPVAAPGVAYFLDGEPFEAEASLPAGTVSVRCLAGGLSASAEVDVPRGGTRRVECFPHQQPVDVAAFWDGAPTDATVALDGGEATEVPVRLQLAAGRHTLRIRSAAGIDSTLTLDVRPTFDPESPPPVAVAIRAGNDPEAGASPISGGTAVAQPPASGSAPVVQTGPPSPQQQPQQPAPQRPQPPAPSRAAGQLVAELAAGVTLSLDGSSIGQGSRDLPPGTYTVTCQAGPLSESMRVTISPNQRTPVRCYAPSQVVSVSATSDDPARPWMSIVVNGETVGQTPGRVTLGPGRNTVFVRRRGYEVVGQDIVTVDVPPRFTPDAPAPMPLSFQFRAANAP